MSIRQRGPRSFEVRIGTFSGNKKTQPEAEALERQFEQWRAEGRTHAPIEKDETLRAACQEFRRSKEDLLHTDPPQMSEGGFKWWNLHVTTWEQRIKDQRGRLISDYRCQDLSAPWVRRYVRDRYRAGTPTAARSELAVLKAILKEAAADEVPINHAILYIKPLPHTPRVGRALTEEQLEFLAEHFLDYMANLVRLGGTIGCRIMELLTIEDMHVDLEARRLILPSEMVKEGRRLKEEGIDEKRIPLTRHEVGLWRRQKLVRAPGTLYFPRRYGSPWSHNAFWDKIWAPALRRASRDWRAEHGGDTDPFIWGPDSKQRFRPHDLRHTAATWMRDHGFTKEEAATRLGHGDSGKLINAVYDHSDAEERVAQRIELLDLAEGI
jgi:integrase